MKNRMTNSRPLASMPMKQATTNKFPVNTKHFSMLPGDMAIKGRATENCCIKSDKGPTLNAHQKSNKAMGTKMLMKGEP